jgi:DNA-binding HxlR family transcriptional regulator
MFGDRRHFRTLQRESDEGIASNILATRLRDLLAAGLLTQDDPGPGRHAAYSLTEPSIQFGSGARRAGLVGAAARGNK